MPTNLRSTAIGILFAIAAPILPQQTYQHPPREIVDVLDTPAPPVSFVSPVGNVLILATPVRYRPISDLAEPMLHGAGPVERSCAEPL